ncbi:MAG: DUF5682 family protein [Gammaproteobacteria bacterium]
MSTHFYGIRHHGAGSARSLLDALHTLQPDALLIEGPAELESIIPLAVHAQMQPPVAALVYGADDTKLAAYYPFAVFSPEWQALHYGLSRNLPVQFMDLPMSLQFGLQVQAESGDEDQAEQGQPALPSDELLALQAIRRDPLKLLAEAAGFDDSERWWSHWIEERRDSAQIFTAIAEAMTALREEIDPLVPESRRERLREAHMRKILRAAEKQGHQRIAVVCGAWHVPALQRKISAKQDNELLKGLAKVKTVATWIPWTYERLSLASGYGAGIESPNWYHYLWEQPEKVVVHWLAQVAQLFREHDLDISSAHVIESVRLAESLAALRGRPLPGLDELNEAVQAVMLFGDALPMQLLHHKLIVGERLGQVPDDAPTTPLQQDLAAQQKRLRLPPAASHSELTLDLRKDNDLQRSHLLRRLRLLGIHWGRSDYARGKGTFKEAWRLQWQPEFVIRLIEAGRWGHTVAAAAGAYTIAQARQSNQLETLTQLAQDALFANLDEAVAVLVDCLQAQAAVAADVLHLMQVLPGLAELLRYGDVRNTSLQQVGVVVSGLMTRICIGLPAACTALNAEAAEQMFERIQAVQNAVVLLANGDYNVAWYGVLAGLSQQQNLHGLLAGHCCRLLLQADHLDSEAVAQRLSVALSTGNDPAHAAAWADGFLRGGGQLLVYDETLWQIIDAWVCQLPAEAFQQILPLLRRTFSSFDAPIRRQLGERVQHKQAPLPSTAPSGEFDAETARAVLPLLGRILGLEV